MLVNYPAIFYYVDNGYFVYFPDLNNSGTQGKNEVEALTMASEFLGMTLAHEIEENTPLPKASNINELNFEKNNPFKDDEDMELIYDKNKSFISMVIVNVTEYLGSNEAVKKTLTIPKWANDLGSRRGFNFSKLLTEAIAEAGIK